jgi:hypothetical protein
MAKEENSLWIMFSANIPTLGFLVLTGWFAYLDNGYWGWPFVIAILCARVMKTSDDKFEEERKKAEAKAEAMKKYGYNIFQ